MSTAYQVKAGFYAYLDREFGPGLTGLIKPPEGARVGERVLYLLADGHEVQRAHVERANREFEKDIAFLATELAEEIDGLQYSIEPAVSSGLPYPRAIDIPYVTELALGNLAANYADSPAELPAKEFSLRWLFGVVFTYSAKYLLYLDFMHPRVRALYVAEYDVEYGYVKSRAIAERLQTFIIQQAELAKMADAREDVIWVKLVQMGTAMHTALKTRDNLVHSTTVGAR